MPKSEMDGEESWPTQPIRRSRRRTSKHTFTVADISPYLAPAEADALKKRLVAATTKECSRRSAEGHRARADEQRRTLFGGAASEPKTGAVYLVAHENPGILHLQPPAEGRGGGGGGGGLRGRGAPPSSGAPPELIAGSGSAWTRPNRPTGAVDAVR